jgi:hypothetical protein
MCVCKHTHQDHVIRYLGYLVRAQCLETIFGFRILQIVLFHERHKKLQLVNQRPKDERVSINALTLRLITLSSVIRMLDESLGALVGIASFGRMGSRSSLLKVDSMVGVATFEVSGGEDGGGTSVSDQWGWLSNGGISTGGGEMDVCCSMHVDCVRLGLVEGVRFWTGCTFSSGCSNRSRHLFNTYASL